MMNQILAHGPNPEGSYPVLAVLFVIVVAIWIWGYYSPKVRCIRISTVISFVLLAAVEILILTFSNYPWIDVFYPFILIILFLGGAITLAFWSGLSPEFSANIADYSCWACILLLSLIINASVIFGIIKLISYLWRKIRKLPPVE